MSTALRSIELEAALAKGRALVADIREALKLSQRRSAGGSGSGNFGHAGRPGEVGGSAPSEGDVADVGLIQQAVALSQEIKDQTGVVASVDRQLLPVGKTVLGVLREMKASGYAMPDDVQIFRSSKASASGRTITTDVNWKLAHVSMEIDVPESVPVDKLDDAIAVAFGGRYLDGDEFSVRSMRDIVIHEMGHVQDRQKAHDDYSFQSAAVLSAVGKAGAGEPKQHAYERVMDAARSVSIYGSRKPVEFKAEAFLRMYRGETLTPDAMKLYEALGGPEVFARRAAEFDPNQPRDEAGKWTDGNAGTDTTGVPDPIGDAQAAAGELAHALGQELGVLVDPGAASIARAMVPVVREMRAKGYTMPGYVSVGFGRDTSDAEGEYNWKDRILKIKVDPAVPLDKLDDAVEVGFGGKTIDGYDRFAIRSMRDIAIHEMGHVQAFDVEAKPDDVVDVSASSFKTKDGRPLSAAFAPDLPNSQAVDRMFKAIRSVSDYASRSAYEFKAEAFTRLYRGETLTPDAMKLYELMRGPKVLK